MKAMKVQFYQSHSPIGQRVALCDSQKIGELAHSSALQSFGNGQAIGGTLTGSDVKIAPALKKIGHKGTIKIKKGAAVGLQAGNSKSVQLLARGAQRGNSVEGSASLAVQSSNGFPNNTQALALGNLSNIQLLQRQQCNKTKSGKLILVRQKKNSSSLSQGSKPGLLPVKQARALTPMHVVGKTEPSEGFQYKSEANLVAPEAGLVNVGIKGINQDAQEAVRQSSTGPLNQPLFVQRPDGSGVHSGHKPSMLVPQSTPLAQTLKRVHFQQPEQKPTMEQLELNRRQNSQRQVLIRKHNEPPQRRRGRHHHNPQMQKSGSMFSYSVSTKTNLSAPTVPLGDQSRLKRKPSPPLPSNPNPQVKQLAKTRSLIFSQAIGASNTKISVPLKIRKKSMNALEKNDTLDRILPSGFKAQQRSQSVTSAADVERLPSLKATLPLKSIKFHGQNKQAPKVKPPLHTKQKNAFAAPPASVEDILKLADEGIASIDQELFQKEQPEQGKPNKQKISSNFNLSFNNSFNTSYTNSQQKLQDAPQPSLSMLQFQSTLKKQKESEDSKQHDYSGYITKDAIILEKQLADHLQNLGDGDTGDDQSRKRMQAHGQTFDEVIKRDKSFGSLLLKIKQAYDDYLRKQVDEPSARSSGAPGALVHPLNQPIASLTTSSHAGVNSVKLQNLQTQLDESQQRAMYQAKQIKELQENLAKKEIENQDLKERLERLAERQMKDVGVQTVTGKDIRMDTHIMMETDIQRAIAADQSIKSGSLQVRGDNAANMSLSLSNRSATDLHLPIGGKQVSKAESLKGSNAAYENREQILEDMSKLVQQNRELNDACASMDEEIGYLKLREKKIMYLVHLLQNRGYPVQRIYEEELKQVPTMRMQEFLDEKEREHYEKEYGGPEIDDKYHFSFHTDDSFEPIADGPALKPVKPDSVPLLDLEGLPGYETSSDEADEEDDGQEPPPQDPSQQQSEHFGPPPFHYQESMKYIQDFYDKYHNKQVPGEQNFQEDASGEQALGQAAGARHPASDQRKLDQHSGSLISGEHVIEEDFQAQ